MKKQFNSIALLAVVSASLFVSCSKDTDLYDSNLAQKEYEQKWVERFGEVAADQDWNLATQVTATMSITEDALAKYNLQLFTANPLYDEDALLIADYEVETDANGYATVTFKCDVAKSATQLYAVRKDSHNRRLVKLADISNGTIDVSFGGASTKAGTRASLKSADMNETKVECSYTQSEVTSMVNASTTTDIKDAKVRHQTYTSDFTTFADAAMVSSTSTVKVTKGMTLTTYFECAGGYTTSNDTWNSSAPSIGQIKLIITNNSTVSLGTNNNKISYMDIIVDGGATLDISSLTSPLQLLAGARIIIMPGGNFIDNTKTRAYSVDMQGELFYNAGTMNVDNIKINAGLVYNEGVINAADITMEQTSTTLTNWGKIYCNSVYNKGENGTHQAGLGTVNNNCYLNVKEDFCAAVLNQAANTAIEAEIIQINGTWTVRENSILRADDGRFAGDGNGKAFIKYCGANGEKALVSFKAITHINEAEISDNIYLETNTEIKTATQDGRTYTGGSNHNFLEKAYTAVGGANITIPAGDCTGSGNTPTDKGGGGNENANYWIIACEDLGSTDDYDFNDVVVKIAYVSGSNEVEITPLAAGGTLKSEIYFRDKNGKENRIGEIHQLFGGTQGEDGLYSVVNANGSGKIFDKSNAQTAQSVNYGVTEGFSISNTSGEENMGGFFIKVTENAATGGGVAKTISAPDKKGIVPQMFCVDSNWSWPTEGTSIEDAYPGFKTWTGDTNYTQWTTQAAE